MKIEQTYGLENPFIPDPLSRKALRFLPSGGRLLDAGCGEGADTVFFAKRGFTVTAVDKTRKYLKRLRLIRSGEHVSGISIHHRDIASYGFPRNRYDVIISILVVCCMKRSQFDRMIGPLKRSVKPGGIVVMSARNYLDREMNYYSCSKRPVEANTFRAKDACCKFVYFLEKNRLTDVFHDFDILYSYEGFAKCKYGEHPRHGDSYIICRRRKRSPGAST